MARPKAIVITGNGTNCEREAAAACTLGGFESHIVHISELLSGDKVLDDYHFLNLTGGFLDGDDLGAAMVQANRLRYARVSGSRERLADQLDRFVDNGRPILGVCNGFQLMVKMGLIPAMNERHDQVATLTFNDSGRFEDRWVNLVVDSQSPCIFTRGIHTVTLPVRHGEGKFMVSQSAIMEEMEKTHLLTVKYADDQNRPTQGYPENPNGSLGAVAGICSPSGILFGLMPHPEAYLHRVNHPRWTREDLPEEGAGVIFFRNACQYIKESI
ncbi:phosphoribosylformylglycinamidine synthase subunit PurQ [bacterium]|nr:MAG: phosphoribosylformylglycinamidine synthase subunit PurQ [bacterium]